MPSPLARRPEPGQCGRAGTPRSGEAVMDSSSREPTPRVVVGVDGSGPSQEALRWAADHAQLTGAVVE
ncbi:universal stress protein, partial [Streptomyces sp. NRRL S-15]|uniref:universal stress protein n=1 Tax=Streptomyces sp. NRRL S-15 TaxID=1463886 RepID=UPI003B63BA39